MATPSHWAKNWVKLPSTPPISLTAKTPVSNAPIWHRLKIELRKKLPTVIDNEKIYKNAASIKIVEEALKYDDPRKIWVISDSEIGKELLLNGHNNKPEKILLPNTTWFGQIDLDDKDSMKRLNAYLHKEKYVDKIAKQSATHKGFSR